MFGQIRSTAKYFSILVRIKIKIKGYDTSLFEVREVNFEVNFEVKVEEVQEVKEAEEDKVEEVEEVRETEEVKETEEV